MANETSTAVIQLPKGKKNLVQLGAICLTVSIACYGLALSTLITPILSSMDAMGYVGLFSIFSSIGITIMTPIGGKLGDIFGRRRIVVIAGLVCVLCGVGIAFAPNLPVLMICRFGVGFAQGAFMAAPYIIVGVINEKKDVPKAMGFLAMALSIGGFGGSIVAGLLTDMGMLTAAILFPAIPLIVGIVLIGLFYPDDKSAAKQKIDTVGILLLVAALCGILLPLNYGATVGWTDPLILGGLVLGIVFTALLVRYESKIEQPIIPVKMFRHKSYLAFVLVGFLCYFYRGAMDVYSPLGAINVMGTSTTTAGSLQLPRTIVTMFLPVIAGAWVGKKRVNLWKAMAIATALAAFPMLAMGFTTPQTSVLLYFIALTITGVAESYRGVSVTPAAQGCLKTEDIGIGTALVNFANSLAGSLAAAIYGMIYGACTAADPTNVANIQKGVNAVFLTAGGVTVVGLLLVLFWVRPLIEKQAREEVRQT